MANIEARNKRRSLLQFGLVIALLILVNVLANARIGGRSLYETFDLTEDRRFTLTDYTVGQVEELDEVLFARILLDGDLPAEYQRLQDAVRNLLEDLRSRNDLVEFEFSDPLVGDPDDVRQRQQNLAEEEGIVPVPLVNQSANQREVKAIYPYAIIYHKGRQAIVNLLETETPGIPTDVILNKANALLEYKFSSAIERLTDFRRPLIAFSTGHGELPPIRTADLEQTLRERYEVGRLDLDSVVAIPQEIKAFIVAKPTRPFDARDAFKLDQYVMNGGKIFWAIDPIMMSLDSLRGRNEFYPNPNDLGEVEDLFFRYGFRLNQNLVLDLFNTRIPIQVGTAGGQPRIEKFPYPYHVLSLPGGKHPIVKSLDPIDLRFPSSIDLSVGGAEGIEKTVLLTSSDRARIQRLPSAIDLDVQKYSLDLERFDESGLVMGALLEGTFNSPFANRLSTENLDLLRQIGQDYQASVADNRMVIVADGDLFSSSITRDGNVRPLGYNAFEDYQFDNKTFVLNALEYLINDEGVIAARGKEVKLRLLDRDLAREEAGIWRVVNIGLPLLFLVLFGVAYHFIRRRRYAK